MPLVATSNLSESECAEALKSSVLTEMLSFANITKRTACGKDASLLCSFHDNHQQLYYVQTAKVALLIVTWQHQCPGCLIAADAALAALNARILASDPNFTIIDDLFISDSNQTLPAQPTDLHRN